jgi:argininosuccinate lyase
MDVHIARAAELAAGYFVGSTALMEWLVTTHGLPLRRAKRVVETAVRLSDVSGSAEVTAPALRAALDEHGVSLELEEAHVTAVQRPEAIVRAARTAGGPAPEAVDAAIAALHERLDAGAATLEACHGRIKTAHARLRAAAAALATTANPDR